MANITTNNPVWGMATYIPNEFIDKHMTDANGEYVKIYLYLLRCMGQTEKDISICKIAEHFDHTEKDVKRALSYWEKMKLLKLEYDGKDNLSSICLLTGQETTYLTEGKPAAEPAKHDASHIRAASIPEKQSVSADSIKNFCQRADVQELIFLTETYLGRTISRTDLEYIFSWYDQLQFPTELIEFLIENCIARGHSSLRYMQKVAEDWYAQNIQTPEQAKQLTSRNNETYYVVLKAFGIRGRNLIPAEMDMLKKWSTTYGFSKEMISEACNRTMQNIHEPSFEYTDSILTNWHNAALRTLEDVKKADETYAKQHTSRSKTAVRQNQTNKFNNFQQRDYDYDQLSQQLLEKSMQ